MKTKLILKRTIITGFIIFFVFSYIRQSMTMNRIQKEIDSKQVQLNEIKQKNERLQDEVDKINSSSSDYLEKLARERLGMIKPGEKVVNGEITNQN
ncbi:MULTISPECIES: FtsB family cell division protein [Clostridium]|jgi:Septum formation initiator|uniref:Cell division protein FtsL n=3 Tax=Clostridium TaxID=1485 RepID=A0AAV3W6S0_9CLOT|nr:MULTISPECIES: septum formation initiator family protein [Clostridium]ALB48516.1 septum formation initiator family protein [Clostridium beijerinckii NRRL B-598]AVK49150.1 septum formation inhibitor MinC [Clostridium sp. MF28]MBC2460086.1 septum formation initiator family protein [Clostridium beijerinckii]MBC2476864.1 septum formation initiator family protein [Clostridium beijerinckii]MCI1478835.1 septum formation initiator family protein [Clostridium beijerinckii]